MARRLFLTGRLRSGFMVTRRAPDARAAHGDRAGKGIGERPRDGRSTFAVGRRTPERSGVRSVQFPRVRPAPLPGPWALAAVVTGDA